jgi:hypothetical protein
VVVVVLGVELVAPEVLPPTTKPPEEPLAGPALVEGVSPVLGPPIELVLPEVLPLAAVSPLVPAVLPVPELDGLVLLPGEPVPEVPAAWSRLLQALSESAATTASVATATCVRDVFIRKLLEGLYEIRKGSLDHPNAHSRQGLRAACRYWTMIAVGQPQRQGFRPDAVEPGCPPTTRCCGAMRWLSVRLATTCSEPSPPLTCG